MSVDAMYHEGMRRLQDALASYDRALELDRHMTLAYLGKGGIFNRLEKYDEALECYDLALRSQEVRKPSA